MVDEMLQSNAECQPNDIMGDIVFAALSRREWPGRTFNGEEIVGLLSRNLVNVLCFRIALNLRS
jgi:hypothetical protein